jgi:D-glycero-alpha-D-manno-heptose-7-phosphate kinase
MFAIKAQAPTRIDIAGGTLDLWPLHHLVQHKCTVNVGVSVYANVEITLSSDKEYHLQSSDQNKFIDGQFSDVCKDTSLALISILLESLWDAKYPALTIRTHASSPQGAGLGGSSSLGVALAAALNALRHKVKGAPLLNEEAIVHLVCNAEAKLLHIPTGFQDHWGAMRGGLNIIHYPLSGAQVETLNSNFVNELGKGLVLCYSGQSRISADNNWTFFKRVVEGDSEVLLLLEELGACAEECAKQARHGNLAGVLLNSSKEWAVRKKLWPTCETEETRRLERIGCDAGASFARICGAGGGGVMLFFCEPESREGIVKSLRENGGTILEGKPIRKGLKVWEDISSIEVQGGFTLA